MRITTWAKSTTAQAGSPTPSGTTTTFSTGYPGNSKIAVSHLHKGKALLEMKNREGAIAEFRALIQRFPNSPEASPGPQ